MGKPGNQWYACGPRLLTELRMSLSGLSGTPLAAGQALISHSRTWRIPRIMIRGANHD
jgi:hypothetical protein